MLFVSLTTKGSLGFRGFFTAKTRKHLWLAFLVEKLKFVCFLKDRSE